MFRPSPLHLAVALFVAALNAHAQDDGAPVLAPSTTLSGRSLGTVEYSDKVKLGILNMAQDHPEVLAAQASLASSGFETEAAKRARFPRFSLATATGRSSTFTSPGNTSSQRFTALTASARVSLLDAGGINARERAATANSSALEEGLRVASQKVVLDGITTYLQVQRFDLKKRIAARSTLVLDELTRAEQRKVELGAAGQGDARLAASRRSGAAAKRQEFDALLIDALAKFETYFKFVPNAAGLPTLATPKEWAVGSLAQAIQIAEANSAELGEARGRIERAKANVDREKSGRFPTLDAVVSRTKDNRDLTTEPTRAALELNFNLGNGFDVQSRIKAALVEVGAQEARLEAARANLVEVTSASWGRTSSGADRVKQLMEAVSEAGLAYQSKRRLLGFGRETLPNVLDAQLEHFNLLLDLADGVFDLRIAEFRLARTSGRLLVDGVSDNGWIHSVVSKADANDIFSESLRESVCRTDNANCNTASVPLPPEPRSPVLKRSSALGAPVAALDIEPRLAAPVPPRPAVELRPLVSSPPAREFRPAVQPPPPVESRPPVEDVAPPPANYYRPLIN
ncbi:MAG: TolC family protein [Pseudomonadota bacterium]